jgi:hypothetical protein
MQRRLSIAFQPRLAATDFRPKKTPTEKWALSVSKKAGIGCAGKI